MDWVNYIPSDGFYPSGGITTGNQDSNTPGGSYDAIRVYLWAGMMDSGGTLRAQVAQRYPRHECLSLRARCSAGDA